MDYATKELPARWDEIPDEPGCYLFKDRGKPLYVGKAKSLRKRLRQYFGARRSGDPKTVAMLARARTVEVVLTANETEALLLEMTLIDKHNPPYNVSLHGFPYIKITNEKFPRLFVTREVPDRKTGKYVGPFTDAKAVRRTVALTNRAFGLRRCRYDLDGQPPARPCLDYEIGVCVGPCAGAIGASDYAARLDRALQFITGRRAGIVRELERRMAEAAAALAFEEAAAWRDVLRGLNRAVADQYAVARRNTHADVAACDVRGEALYGVVLRIREGRLVDRVAVKTEAPVGDALEQFLLGHYGAGAEIPPKVAVRRSFAGRAALALSLAEKRGGPVAIIVPRWGEFAHLVAVAEKNLAYFVEASELDRARRGELEAVFEEVAAATGANVPLRRVEMIDVSNLGTSAVVGSLAAFGDGIRDKNRYRRYRIKAGAGRDDLASLAEITRRRFGRVKAGAEEAPDLFVVDGGTNQLAAATRALRELGLPEQTVAAFAKNPDRLYVVDGREPVPLSEAATLFLARLRDEAHRFAVEYHRTVRARGVSKSILDEVAGVGPTRKKALLKHFGSVEKIAAASEEELRVVPAMNARAARAVYAYLHGAREGAA